MEIHAFTARVKPGLGLFFLATAAAASADDGQVDRLMHPTPAQLAAEAKGTVMIYDGLPSTEVANAMDRHFDRIENMMFTRIQHLPPPGAGGEAYYEDDGCD